MDVLHHAHCLRTCLLQPQQVNKCQGLQQCQQQQEVTLVSNDYGTDQQQAAASAAVDDDDSSGFNLDELLNIMSESKIKTSGRRQQGPAAQLRRMFDKVMKDKATTFLGATDGPRFMRAMVECFR